MRIVLLIGTLVVLSGCANTENRRVVGVDVPVSVPCAHEVVERPLWPTENLGEEASLFERVQALVAERALRQAYEARLEAELGQEKNAR